LAGGSPGGSSTFADNRFEHCRTAGIDVASEYIDCVRDTILSSGAGARLLATGMWAEQRVVAEENVILSCGGNGMTVRAGNAQIDRNVVGRCGGNGIEATTTGIYGIGSGVRGNTCYLNSGSGFVLALSGAADAIDHNLGHGNGRHGLELVADRPVTLGCDDWFANTAGALQGVEAAATDLAVDPRFCDLPEDDVHLAADSPLASPAGCGLVGALGIGCQVTAVLVGRFSASRVPAGMVVIGWRVSGALASPLRVGRAAGARGPWVAVIGAPEPRGSLLTLVDREADPGRAYWYRLIEDSAGGQVLSEVSVEAMARGAFALDPVAGSPGPGPFAIRFRLPASAIVDIEVLDLQGRRTARLASGTWPAGTHALQWSGPADGGRLRPGVHLVRYRFPGGQATQRLVVIR